MSSILCRSLAAALFFVICASAGARENLSQNGELLDRIVAVVNDGVVLQSELDLQTRAIIAQLEAQKTQLPPEDVIRQQILERLVVTRIQLQRAERIGIKVSDDMLNRGLAKIAERNGFTISQLPAIMAAQGMDYSRYREQMRQDIIIDKLRETEVDSRVPVSRREVEQVLAKQSEQRSNTEYLISHILVALPANASPEQVSEVQTKADDIHKRLNEGENFARMAVAYSAGQQALQGGQLGWRKAGELPTLFADQVLELDAGDISPPIRSASGFHIVRVDDLRGAEKSTVHQRHARHILIRTNEVVTDESARARLTLLRQQIIEGADFGDLAKENSDDTASAAERGDLSWVDKGSFVPAFEEALDRLQPGELSEPFQTPFGWHIVELLGSRNHDNTEDVSRQRAYEQVWRRKLESEVEVWVQQIRDEAFVEYRL